MSAFTFSSLRSGCTFCALFKKKILFSLLIFRNRFLHLFFCEASEKRGHFFFCSFMPKFYETFIVAYLAPYENKIKKSELAKWVRPLCGTSRFQALYSSLTQVRFYGYISQTKSPRKKGSEEKLYQC